MEDIEIVVDCFWVNPKKIRGIGLSSLYRLDLLSEQSNGKIFVITSFGALNFFFDRYRAERFEIIGISYLHYFLYGYANLFSKKLHGNKLWLSLGNFPGLSRGGIEIIVVHDFAWNSVRLSSYDYKKFAYKLLLLIMFMRSSKAKFISCVAEEALVPCAIKSYSEIIQSIGNPVRYYEHLINNKKEFDAIVVGPNSPVKRLELVPKIIAKLDDISNVVIVGRKEDWAKELNCSVTFTDVITDEEVQQYISKSKNLIVTSSSESFSYPIHYALYYNCNIIGTKDLRIKEDLKSQIRHVGI